MKRAGMLALVLCFAFILASCGDAAITTEPQSSEPQATSDVWQEDGLDPSLDFGGQPIRILSRSDEWFYDELSLKSDEVMNVIDESVALRKNYVEERIGVELKVNKESCAGNFFNLTNMARNYFSSAVDAYDILAGSCAHLMPLTLESMMYDLNNVENIDLSAPWYSQNFVELSSVNDQTMFVTGDCALSLMRLAFVTFVNLDIADRYGITDIYEKVKNKEWTIDYLSTAVFDIYDDVNADGQADANDLFGLTMSNSPGIDLFWSSFDMAILANNGDGSFDIVLDHEKVGDALVALCELYYDNPGVYVQQHHGNLEFAEMDAYFSSGLRLFVNNMLISVESQNYISLESPYGILPTPLWSSDQESYRIFVQDQYTVFGIPGTVPDDRLAAAGALLEVMSNYSYNETRDAYFEVALKGRYARDEESRAMLDMIIDSIYIDAAWIYVCSTNYFANSLRSLVQKNMRNWSSYYRAQGKILEHCIEKFNTDYGPVK